MKKTTREFGVCPECKGYKKTVASYLENEQRGKKDNPTCILCDGTGGILIKETIEESDDMKEFIEKKCGWVLMEPVKEVSWRKITFN